jgi:hypothetical protein
MDRATFADSIDDEWMQVASVRLERRPTHPRTPDQYVLVDDGVARFRCEIYLTDSESFVFEDVQAWHELLLIGFGSTLYTVDFAKRAVCVHPLDDYFGSILTGDAHCLVASGSRILRIDRDGSKLWESDRVAVDGVIISSVEVGTVYGDGEWNPPGGWRPYAISLETGHSVLPQRRLW